MKTKRLCKFSPCREAVEYMSTQKNSTLAWQNCERGDWMLWIAKKLNVDDKKLTMAKAMCAKQVEHLMKDQRSKDALQACFDYVNGKITREQLNAYAAAYAAYAAYAAAADKKAMLRKRAKAADADKKAMLRKRAKAAYAAARYSSLKKSADICREYLTEEVLNKYKKLR